MFGISRRHQQEVEELRHEVQELRNLVKTLTEKQLEGLDVIKTAEENVKNLKEEVSTKVSQFVEANEDYRRKNGQFKDATVKRLDKVEKHINDEKKRKQSYFDKKKNMNNKKFNPNKKPVNKEVNGNVKHDVVKKPKVGKGTVVKTDKNGFRKLK